MRIIEILESSNASLLACTPYHFNPPLDFLLFSFFYPFLFSLLLLLLPTCSYIYPRSAETPPSHKRRNAGFPRASKFFGHRCDISSRNPHLRMVHGDSCETRLTGNSFVSIPCKEVNIQ